MGIAKKISTSPQKYFIFEIQVNGMKLHYKQWGTGSPVVILHGLFGSLDNWQTIAKKMAGNFQVYAVDQRNHGNSPHSDDHTYSLMASDLREFCKNKNLVSSHFIGHSMGGKTAMQFALSFPHLIDRLVIVDIGPFDTEGRHFQILNALEQINPKQLTGRKEAEMILRKRLKDRNLCLFLLKNLKRNRQGAYEWKMNLKTITRHYSKMMEGIHGNPFYGPVLFIRGKNSPYIQDTDMENIIDLFPSAQFKTIKEAGHWLHWEKPETFIRLTSSFLRGAKIDNF